MITIIIAGGSGSRLWPLSTNDYPKHLLNITGDETLLQGTYRRAKRVSDHVYVVTAGDEQLAHIKEQLPELGDDNFIVEPDRRDTAGCFVVGLNHIQSRHDPDEPIAFLHADHYIRDTEGFVQSFRIAQDISRRQQRITLIGVEPDHAATGFGYIQKNGALKDEAVVYEVLGFKEKPDFQTAQRYVRSGQYLWNAGYFVGSVNTFLQTMQEDAPELKERYDRILAAKSPEEYKEIFLSFEKVAIDYALLEKTKKLLVVPASFDWMDLGSFKDVHEVAHSDDEGNATLGLVELEGVENCYVRNDETDKPVAVIGMDNVVVVNTPEGLLVARTDQSQKVKEVVNRLQAKTQAK